MRLAQEILFLHHFVTKKADFFAQFMQLYADEDMTVDKALQHPDWEGNECLLTCNSADGDWTCCLWKAPNKSLQEFQGKKCASESALERK
jgi:hypothetical protein